MADDVNLVIDAAQRIFADLADPQTILKSGTRDWRTPLWQALEEMGLPRAWVPEALGGHALSLSEGFGVIRAAGRAALSVPLVETMIAGWVAGQAGLALPDGEATLIIGGHRASVTIDDGGRVDATARAVPFAGDVRTLVVISAQGRASRIALVPRAACQIESGSNLAGDACNDVRIAVDSVAHATADGLTTDRVLMLAATCRSLQIAGALQTALDMSVTYSMERVAFEKPIAKFQAVQQNLARLAGEVAAAVAASESAADTLAQGDATDDETLLEVASAKVRCGEAAETGSGIAHQVLGAIGFTEEHVLHRFTMRTLSWRDDFGSEMVWARRLGERVSAASSGELWRLLSAR